MTGARTRYIAAFDIGTTAVKAALVDEDGALAHPQELPLATRYGPGGQCEQRPADWFAAVAQAAGTWWAAGMAPAGVAALALSGQMQDVIPLDAGGAPTRDAILYSDMRAGREAADVAGRFAGGPVLARLGNPLTAASVLPKLLWLRAHEPDAFARTRRILVGSKDYVIAELTGAYVTDPTTASTTGSYDLAAGDWEPSLGEAYALPPGLLPEIRSGDARAGGVGAAAADRTGFVAGTPVFCGLGDAAATTLGANVTELGESYLYLGTTGWLAHLAPLSAAGAAGHPALFRLAGVRRGETIRIAPVLNAGNVVTWALRLLGHRDGEDAAPYLARFESEAAEADDGGALLFVPYLQPERCPVYDEAPNGALLGLSVQTTRAQILRAVLEGTALSLRWCAQLLDVDPARPLRVVGGGTRSGAWLQTIADAFDTAVHAAGDGGMLPARGAAALAATTLGWAASPAEFLRRPADAEERTLWPRPGKTALLQRKYDAFVKAVEDVGRLRL